MLFFFLEHVVAFDTVCFYFNWTSITFSVSLNEKIDDNCWNIDQVLQITSKWSNWRLIRREQDGTNVSFISHIHVRFLSCVISFIILPKLLSPSSTAFLTSLLRTILKYRSRYLCQIPLETMLLPIRIDPMSGNRFITLFNRWMLRDFRLAVIRDNPTSKSFTSVLLL